MNTTLQGKHIVLGITGSIAAYKSCLIIRQLIRAGAEVQVVITPAGKEFITPITLSALTSKPVVSEFFAQRDGTWHSHVQLGLWADAMLIAPATASTIGKMAHGIADNMLLTTYLSMKAPVFVAPAMDLDMYAHPTTQENLQTLRRHGVSIIEPGTGFLASHLEGKGRMEEPEKIVEVLEKFFSHAAADTVTDGKTVLITAGPTYEKIDPVRFIGNYSSGKMGLALVDECLRRGMRVELVLGPVSQTVEAKPGLNVTRVESALQMYEARKPMPPYSVRQWPTSRLKPRPTRNSSARATLWCCVCSPPATLPQRSARRNAPDRCWQALRSKPTTSRLMPSRNLSAKTWTSSSSTRSVTRVPASAPTPTR